MSHPFKKPHIALICGEASGDEIGAKLIDGLNAEFDAPHISGCPGPAMRAKGCVEWAKMESLQTMGLFAVIKNIRQILETKRRIVQAIVRDPPDIVLFIDQPSLSIRIAKELRAAGVRSPFIQVVAPSVWAYRPERIRKFHKYYDALFTLYKFELAHCAEHIRTHWIGHPTLERAEQSAHNQKKEPFVALYPGSRPSEIRANLPLQLDAVRLFLSRTEPPFSAVIQLASTVSPEQARLMQDLIKEKKLEKLVSLAPFSERRSVMKKASCAIAKSGTITLELALANTPTVVVYKISLLTRLWARYILGVSPQQQFSLPNIITQKKLFPEFIVTNPSAEAIAESLLHQLYRNPISAADLDTICNNVFPQEARPELLAARLVRTLLERTVV